MQAVAAAVDARPWSGVRIIKDTEPGMGCMLLGVTGRNAAGKSTVVEWFEERGWQRRSCSDAIRRWLTERGDEISRETLTEGGRTLRRRGGPGILAEMLLEQTDAAQPFIVDSIRTPEEVEAFRSRPDFLLIEVRAPPAVRWSRMQARGRTGDSTTEAEFLAQEAAEAVATDSAGQALDATAVLADIVIENDAGTEALTAALGLLLEALPDLSSA